MKKAENLSGAARMSVSDLKLTLVLGALGLHNALDSAMISASAKACF